MRALVIIYSLVLTGVSLVVAFMAVFATWSDVTTQFVFAAVGGFGTVTGIIGIDAFWRNT